MTTRADLELFQSALDEAIRRANLDLSDVLSLISGLSPAQARDELLVLFPALIDRWADVAGPMAAQWYESVRFAAVGGQFTAPIAAANPLEAEAAVRKAAGFLFQDNSTAAFSLLVGATHRLVSVVARTTIADAAGVDPLNPMFARVPRGVKTCAFCLMLASQGWVYHSRETARQFTLVHDHCDCQVVPEWGSEPAIEGYDPGELYALYARARDMADGSDRSSVLSALRSLGVTSDAHVPR